jgi:hypothetical protein
MIKVLENYEAISHVNQTYLELMRYLADAGNWWSNYKDYNPTTYEFNNFRVEKFIFRNGFAKHTNIESFFYTCYDFFYKNSFFLKYPVFIFCSESIFNIVTNIINILFLKKNYLFWFNLDFYVSLFFFYIFLIPLIFLIAIFYCFKISIDFTWYIIKFSIFNIILIFKPGSLLYKIIDELNFKFYETTCVNLVWFYREVWSPFFDKYLEKKLNNLNYQLTNLNLEKDVGLELIFFNWSIFKCVFFITVAMCFKYFFVYSIGVMFIYYSFWPFGLFAMVHMGVELFDSIKNSPLVTSLLDYSAVLLSYVEIFFYIINPTSGGHLPVIQNVLEYFFYTCYYIWQGIYIIKIFPFYFYFNYINTVNLKSIFYVSFIYTTQFPLFILIFEFIIPKIMIIITKVSLIITEVSNKLALFWFGINIMYGIAKSIVCFFLYLSTILLKDFFFAKVIPLCYWCMWLFGMYLYFFILYTLIALKVVCLNLLYFIFNFFALSRNILDIQYYFFNFNTFIYLISMGSFIYKVLFENFLNVFLLVYNFCMGQKSTSIHVINLCYYIFLLDESALDGETHKSIFVVKGFFVENRWYFVYKYYEIFLNYLMYKGLFEVTFFCFTTFMEFYVGALHLGTYASKMEIIGVFIFFIALSIVSAYFKKDRNPLISMLLIEVSILCFLCSFSLIIFGFISGEILGDLNILSWKQIVQYHGIFSFFFSLSLFFLAADAIVGLFIIILLYKRYIRSEYQVVYKNAVLELEYLESELSTLDIMLKTATTEDEKVQIEKRIKVKLKCYTKNINDIVHWQKNIFGKKVFYLKSYLIKNVQGDKLKKILLKRKNDFCGNKFRRE